jgi:hypothetical protein
VPVAKHIIQTYIARVLPAKPTPDLGDLFEESREMYLGLRLPIIDVWFRPPYLFFVVELTSQGIVHFNITAHPKDEWGAQPLREATPFGQAPSLLDHGFSKVRQPLKNKPFGLARMSIEVAPRFGEIRPAHVQGQPHN